MSVHTIEGSPQRIHLVDSLRGFALLGLFLVHCLEYFEIYWMAPQPHPLRDVVFLLFANKAYAVFAMLFGVSFFIIMDRQARKGVDFSGRFAWRLLILLVFGSLHAALYMGDILQVLAIIGITLTFANHLSNRVLIGLAAICILQLPNLYFVFAAMADLPGANEPLRHWAMYSEAFAVLRDASLSQVFAQNAWAGMQTKWMYVVESGRGVQLAGLFMIGLVLGRIGFFERPEQFQRQRRLAFCWALGLSLVLWLCLRALHSLPDEVFAGREMLRHHADQALNVYLSSALTAMGVIIFIHVQQFNVVGRFLNVLAPCGRMSLSIYLLQSIICVPLFYPFGLALYESIGQVGAFYLGLAIFAGLILFAHVWMRFFHYGPAEWLWRAATYLTFRVPLRRLERGQPYVSPITPLP